MSNLTNLLGLIPMTTDILRMDNVPALAATLLLDATTEKCVFVGAVWHPTIKTGTINIRKVHFRSGAVTLDAASVFRVSLQNISATVGPPFQPDGTQDQTADLTVSTLTNGGWTITGDLSTDRAVNLANDSFGDADSRVLAVVFEFQTFTAADSVVISTSNAGSGATPYNGMGGAVFFNGSAWTYQTSLSSVVAFECDDGTFAFLQGAMPVTGFGSTVVDNDGAIRRAGVKFKVPVELKIDRMSLLVAVGTSAAGRFVLYDSDGTTELRSVDIDEDTVASTLGRYNECLFEPVTLLADTFYRFAFVGGTAVTATIYYLNVDAVGLMDGFILGQNAHWTQADSAETWTDTTTRRPHFGIGISAIHSGVDSARANYNLGV